MKMKDFTGEELDIEAVASKHSVFGGLKLSDLCASLSDTIMSTTPKLNVRGEEEVLRLLEHTRANVYPSGGGTELPQSSKPVQVAPVGESGGGSGVNKNKVCRVCGQTGELKCSGCNKARYCSRACQKIDWKKHKKTCKSARG
jgi:hypothetical protein